MDGVGGGGDVEHSVDDERPDDVVDEFGAAHALSGGGVHVASGQVDGASGAVDGRFHAATDGADAEGAVVPYSAAGEVVDAGGEEFGAGTLASGRLVLQAGVRAGHGVSSAAAHASASRIRASGVW